MPGTSEIPEATPIGGRGYAHPDVLVSTAWVADHLDDPAVRLIECSEDPLRYDGGHLPGAVSLDGLADLGYPVTRDVLSRDRFEKLVRALGISTGMRVVFYGDGGNQWASHAFWVFRLYDVRHLALVDGGRARWEQEGRPLTTRPPASRTGTFTATERRDAAWRAFRHDVERHMVAGRPLVDVRSPEEYRGEAAVLARYPREMALRSGHIPGAVNIPWDVVLDPVTHTFRAADDLRVVYLDRYGLAPDADVITYCRIGERSSLTWFVLTWLLGFHAVRNYDGSWTEWGNLVGAPIAR